MNMIKKMDYKKIMWIPIIFLIICMGFLYWNYQETGEYFTKSVDLTGGSQLSVEVQGDVDIGALESHLNPIFGDVSVRKVTGVGGVTLLIRAGEDVDGDALLEEVEEYGIDPESHSFEKIGASLGESFFAQSLNAMIFAFIFMGLVVFFVFRNFVPSIAVIWCAFSDIICTLALMQVFGIELSLASFAALLLVLGYSIDTDILLTTRLIKRREGKMDERIREAFKTGMTMSATTLLAFTALYMVSGATALREIATVLIIALVIDIPNTWLTNLGILRWWAEKRGIE